MGRIYDLHNLMQKIKALKNQGTWLAQSVKHLPSVMIPGSWDIHT